MTNVSKVHMNGEPGVLYVVATPIGHLSDLSPRAVEILNAVDVIAAEDTRHSQRLKKQAMINTPFVAYHAHNEAMMAARLLKRLQQGESIALVSDAGTPLISDPGFDLVAKALEAGITVSPIPGPCAVIAALSVSGLPADSFCFEGFLPAKSQARLTHLQALRYESRTLVFYEAPHRLIKTLEAMRSVWGGQRLVAAIGELTKCHEKVLRASLDDWLDQWGEVAPKGEWVLVVAGSPKHDDGVAADQAKHCAHVLGVLLAELPLKQAVNIASTISDLPKNQVYQMALDQQKGAEQP